MLKQFEGLIVKVIFAVFLCSLILQYHYVYMYFDDYGHASLSYRYVVSGVNGTHFNLNQLLEWIHWYYLNWGGRVIYYFLFLLPLLSKSITLFMFIQSIILFFIFIYLFKIIQSFNENFNPILTILSLMTLYGLLSIDLLKESSYWASASVCYIWSLLPLFMGIYYLMRATKNEKKLKVWEIIIIPILFFFSACSFEQSGAATLVFITFYILYLFLKGKNLYLKLTIPTFIVSFIGVLIQYLSPGNKQRILATIPTYENLTTYQKLRSGLHNVIVLIMDHRISIFILILCILAIIIIALINKPNNKFKFWITPPLILPVLYIIKNFLNFEISNFWKLLLLVILFFYFFLFMYQKAEFVPIIFAAAASIFCLILAPVLQLRSLVYFLIILFIPMVIILNSIFSKINKNHKYIFIAIFITFMTYSFNNYIFILTGYKENYSYAIKNNEKLLSLSKQEEFNGKVQLYKYPNDSFREHMPYDIETPFVKDWVLQYYNLPGTTEIEWIDPN